MVATHTTARVAEIPLPDFGMPDTEPLLPPATFAERLARLRAAMATRGYDHLVVWADREHSANLAFLSGFDPRFEEAVLVVGPSGDPAVPQFSLPTRIAGSPPGPTTRSASSKRGSNPVSQARFALCSRSA